MSTQSTRRRALAGAILALALGAAGVSTNLTAAWFTASRTVPASVSGALLSIGEIGRTSDRTTIDVSGVYPMTDQQALADRSDTQAASTAITIRNTGTIPLDWSMQIVNARAVSPLAPEALALIRFQLVDASGATLSDPLTLGTRPATAVPDGRIASGSGLAAGGRSEVKIRVWLDPSATNELQGAGAAFDVVINARQNGSTATAGPDRALDISARSTGTPLGTGTRIEWEDATARVRGAGLSGDAVYTLERSTDAEFTTPTVVYTGSGTTFDDTVAGPASARRQATSVSGTEESHGMFALIDGKVYRWGTVDEIGSGLLWSGSGDGAATEVTGWSAEIAKLSVGRDHACALLVTGAVQCVGFDSYGQLGDGPELAGKTSPVTINDTNRVFTTPIVDIAAGWGFTCAVAQDGAVGCWGSNSSGQLGVPTATRQSPVPVATAGGDRAPGSVFAARKAVRLAAGIETTCAVKEQGGVGAAAGSDHAVACWGASPFGQLGTAVAKKGVSATPVDIADPAGLLSGVTAIAGGHGVFCVLNDKTATTNAACWGGGGVGLLGSGKAEEVQIPQAVVTAVRGFTSIDVGGTVGCAASPSTIQCWGRNVEGQLGAGDLSQSATISMPRTVVDANGVFAGTTITTVGVSWKSACAVAANGAIGCWGANSAQQLGQGTGSAGEPVPNPVAVDLRHLPAWECGLGATTVAEMCSLSPSVSYQYRLSYRVAGVPGWVSPAVTAARQ